jgi:hypothetical protein
MEESALRRLTILHLAHGDPAQAFAVFSRHVRRFPQSIFAGQARKSFAAELVARPDERATGSLVEAGLRFMAHDAATRFCLEIAEGGLRKGRLELARSAASEAAKRSAMTGPDASTQIRATLYRTVAEVPTAPASETLKALEALKREELTPSDRHLVSVAEQLARAIGNDASPTPAAAAVAASSPEDQLKRARSLLSASTVVLAKGPK